MSNKNKSEDDDLLSFFTDETDTAVQSHNVSSESIEHSVDDESIICLDDSDHKSPPKTRKIKTAKRRCQSGEVPVVNNGTDGDSSEHSKEQPLFQVKFKNQKLSR